MVGIILFFSVGSVIMSLLLFLILIIWVFSLFILVSLDKLFTFVNLFKEPVSSFFVFFFVLSCA